MCTLETDKTMWTAINERFLNPLLRGSGQMLFQPSAVTGGVFLLLILLQSSASFFVCLAGILGSTLCAYALEHPHEDYYEGLGGFNGGLLGLALSVFYEISSGLLLLVFTGGVLTGVLRVVLLKIMPVSPFTTPFVVVAWLSFLCSDPLGFGPVEPPVVEEWRVYGLATNASQVLFMPHPWVGAIVFVAVFLHSRIAALWVAVASLVAWLTALVFDLPDGLIAAGLLGYNGLILAAALQHRDTPVPLVIAGVVITVWLTYLILLTGITPLSAPFVISAWLVIAAEAILAGRRAVPR